MADRRDDDLEKSGLIIAPPFRQVRQGSGAPTAEVKAAMRAFAMPGPESEDQIYDTNEPVFGVMDIVHGFGWDQAMQASWGKFLAETLDDEHTNELHVRQKLYTQMRDDRVEANARRVILRKALRYYRWKRGLNKSMVQVLTPEELVKASPRGGSYHRRVKMKSGRYRYFYNEDDYNKRDDAHLSGKEATSQRIGNVINQRLDMAGEKGCCAKDFVDLVKKYGSKSVTRVIKKQVRGKKLSLKKGRFTKAQEPKPEETKKSLDIPLVIGTREAAYENHYRRLMKAQDYDTAGELVLLQYEEELERLEKAATHKYIRRIPTGKKSPRWRYIYAETGKHHGEDVKVGEKIKLTEGEKRGHYEVKADHQNGWVTIQHDETGKSITVKKEHLHSLFLEEYKEAHRKARTKLEEIYSKAREHGSAKQIRNARKRLEEHKRRYPSPEQRAAEIRSRELSRVAQKANTQEAHIAAAQEHLDAIEAGVANKRLHRQIAGKHILRARAIIDQLKAKKRGKKTGQTASKTRGTAGATDAVSPTPEKRPETEPPKKKSRWKPGQPRAQGYLGSKKWSWDVLMDGWDSGGANGDFQAAHEQYMAWKGETARGSRTKPPPHEGGEADPMNHHLSVEPPDKWDRQNKKFKDKRVSCPREFWDRATAGATKWTDPQVIEAIEVLKTVGGFQDLQLPDVLVEHLNKEAQKQYEEEMYAELQEQYDVKQAEREENLDDSEKGYPAFWDEPYEEETGDTSFDFGANVGWDEPEDEKHEPETPQEQYERLGTSAPLFKSWFGDWESDPENASKVVRKDGKPEEQNPMKPIPVFHGTAVGGFNEFRKVSGAGYNLYGAGLYFTEDKSIAEEYTTKDDDKAVEQANRFVDRHGQTRESLKIGKRKFQNRLKQWREDAMRSHRGNDIHNIWAAFERAYDPKTETLDTGKLLAEYREPSKPIPVQTRHEEAERLPKEPGQHIGTLTGKHIVTIHDLDPKTEGGSGRGIKELVSKLNSILPKGETVKAEAPPAEVFEVFLNVRKPVDMDAPISKEQFHELCKAWTESKDWKMRLSKEAEETTIPIWTKNLIDDPVLQKILHEATGDSMPHVAVADYETMKRMKREARDSVMGEGYKEESRGQPQHKALQLSGKDELTWGDVYYFMSDGLQGMRPKDDFQRAVMALGHDGIKHTGGWNVGTKDHVVWIAFEPTQVKKTQNEGTFDANTAVLTKSGTA